MNILEIQNIHTFYGKTQVIFGLSLSIKKGESICLLGRNGAAKSTTLRSIMGLTPPRSGRIIYKNTTISKEPSHQIARRGIGYAPQDRVIFPDLTVRQNLELPQPGAKTDGIQWTVEKVYEIFPQLRDMQGKLGFTLSGGQQRMLAIGRALMVKPELLLLDEPGEGLSPTIVADLGKALKKIQARGITLLFAEHNLTFALKLSDRVYIIERGTVCYHGTSTEVSQNPQILHRYLGVQPTHSLIGDNY